MVPLTQIEEDFNVIENIDVDDLTPRCDIKDSLPHVKGGRHEVVGDLVVVGEDEIIEACAVRAYHQMYC